MADATLSSARKLLVQMREYLLPPEATVDDIVRSWMDPITRDSANRLPFFEMHATQQTISELGYMINQKTPVDSANYFNVFPFLVDPTSFQDGNIRLYIKAVQSVWSGVYIQTQSVAFSQKARVIVYRETPLDTVNMRIIMYNTLMTPWLDMYTRLLTEGMDIAAQNNMPIKLYIPKAFSGSELTRWDTLDCSIAGMTVEDKLQDVAVVTLALIVEQPPSTTIFQNLTRSQ